MNAFITGTDTGVGKTYITARLIRSLRARGLDTVGFKPLCCGSREDAEILRAAAGDTLTLNEVNPVWFRAPAAPYTASLIENRAVDLDLVRETYASLRARHQSILVEGVGGWLVPILRDYTVADLACEWGLPVIVAVANRLGALNHAALTLQQIRSAGLMCKGFVLNDGATPAGTADDGEMLARATNRSILEEWLGTPVLATLDPGQEEVSLLLSE